MKKQVFTIIILFCFCNLLQGQYVLEATGTNHLRLKTNTVERFGITNFGLFGFGTIAPRAKFHFYNGSAGVFTDLVTTSTIGIIESTGEANLNFIVPANQKAGIVFGNPANIPTGWLKYSNSLNEMKFGTNSIDRVFIKDDGKVGIGTSTPEFNLEVIASSDAGFAVTRYGGDTPGIFGQSSTSILGSASLVTHKLAVFGGRGHNGTSFTVAKSKIEMEATETWSSTATGSNMSFFTTKNGNTSPQERMKIENDGKVGIGETAPQTKLAVNGDISFGVETISTIGNITALDRNNKSVVRLTGAGVVTLKGIAGGVDGLVLHLYNYNATSLTINHDDASASSANRIWTGNASANLVFTGRGGCTLLYDGVNQRWRIIGYND
jgi:hypothetical protein